MNENPENIVPTTKFPLIFIKSLSVLSKKQFSSHYTVAAMIKFAKLESMVPIIISFLVCLLTS